MSPDFPNERKGQTATEAVSDKFGLQPDDSTEWFDAVDANGNKYEIKSTSREVGEDYTNEGRFRLWKDQHRSLVNSPGSWYAFVLFDSGGRVEAIQRRRTGTVTQYVQDRGGWNDSGHERGSKQHKLPHDIPF